MHVLGAFFYPRGRNGTIANQMGGTKSAGSRFITEISLIFRMESPDAMMRKPPTTVISAMRSAIMSGASHCASRKMEPCQQNRMIAASAIPIPNDEAKTIEVTKSSVAFVNRNVSSP